MVPHGEDEFVLAPLQTDIPGTGERQVDGKREAVRGAIDAHRTCRHGISQPMARQHRGIEPVRQLGKRVGTDRLPSEIRRANDRHPGKRLNDLGDATSLGGIPGLEPRHCGTDAVVTTW